MKGAGELLRGPLPLAMIISAGLHLAALSHPGLINYLGQNGGKPKIIEVILQPPGIEKGPVPVAVAGENEPVGAPRKGTAQSEALPLDTDDPRYRTYFEVLKGMIAGSWVYPGDAHRLGARGKVLLEFCLNGEGWLTGVSIAESSGNLNLDRAVVEAVRQAAPFPPPPPSIQRDPFLVSALFVYER